MTTAETFVLVGGGYSGSRAADCLRQEGFEGRIILVGEEQHLPYSRPPLCKKALTSDIGIDRLPLRARAFYDRSKIELVLGQAVTEVDRHARRLRLADGNSIDYDRLLLATGGRCRRLPVPGADLDGVHVIRTFEDSVRLRAEFAPGARLAIIGAGYIGLETAAAASSLDLDVTVIELSGRLMSRVASPTVSEFYARRHIDHGVKLLLHRSAQAIEGVDGRVRSVQLDDGQVVPADIVLMAAGNIPEFGLARDAGLECEGGIVVDDRCRTSDPLIFAAGDCTRHPSVRYGRRIQLESVDNALEQARVAAAGMCGRAVRHSHVPWFWSDQYGLKFQIVGLFDGFDEIVVRGDPDEPGFSVWYLRDGEVLCMEAVAQSLEFMQAGRWIGAHAKVDARVLRDPAAALDEAVVERSRLLAPADELPMSTGMLA